MISYAPFWNMLEKKNISTYQLEKTYGIDRKIIHKLKHNDNMTLLSMESLCRKFNCEIQDIVTFVDEN